MTRSAQGLCAACFEPLTEGVPPAEPPPCTRCGGEPRVDGRYLLLRVLGRSPASTTYEALDPAQCRVALKAMPLRGLPSTKPLELFRRETEILRQLHHPAVPVLIESFETGRGQTHTVVQVRAFVAGHDLEHELAHHRYTASEVLDLVDELLGVLAWLHDLSPPVIHRDLKPANVLRRASDGRLVLLDFGAVCDGVRDEQLGGETIAGTFGYMAPEQFRGDCGPMTDLYALGALAAALLTRKEPRHLLTPGGRLAWEPHTRVDRATHALLDALLEPDPARRPHRAAVVRRWLQSVRRTPAHLPMPPVPSPAGLMLAHPASTPARSVAASTAAVTQPDMVPMLAVAVGLAAGIGLLALLVTAIVTALGLMLL